MGDSLELIGCRVDRKQAGTRLPGRRSDASDELSGISARNEARFLVGSGRGSRDDLD